jgi:hypothetical protein
VARTVSIEFSHVTLCVGDVGGEITRENQPPSGERVWQVGVVASRTVKDGGIRPEAAEIFA